MKIDRFGQAEILSPEQIQHLFTEGFTSSRDKALFGICLYTACRINEACTLFTTDVCSTRGLRTRLLIRRPNTKGKQETREIDIHPQLKTYLRSYLSEYRVCLVMEQETTLSLKSRLRKGFNHQPNSFHNSLSGRSPCLFWFSTKLK